jgi:phosphoribosylaminoimidazole-succinocarboxamide synthase
MQILTESHIVEFPLVSRGKVRDIYEIGGDTLLIVTTDRMSAFDVIMKEPVPYKGVVLNQISLFWMRRFAHLVKNHILEDDIDRFPEELRAYRSMLEGRSVLARKATPLPVECIVRGHISGSGWKDYTATGKVCGHALPPGLKESQELADPLFTPSTKAALGAHDENISRSDGMRLVGKDMFLKIENISLAIFREARDYAATRGIIIADTKFEFGLVGNDLYLIDEALTPDSSRFWPRQGFVPGASQPSFDKQYLRDWLGSQAWDKTPPPPSLPREVIEETARKYREAYAILTGEEFAVGGGHRASQQ